MKKFVILLVSVAVLVGAVVLHGANNGAPAIGEPDDLTAQVYPIEILYETPDEYTPDYIENEALTLTLSQSGHFFNQGVYVEISANNDNARIYYTLDGSIPTSASFLYTDAVAIRAMVGWPMRVVVLRAIAVYGDTISRPLTHTFFLGEDVASRFGDEVLIFSIASDPYGLFDHYNGILVAGHAREEFIRQNPRRNIVPTDPANFNWRGREGERPMSMEVFHADGTRVLAQNAGLRVHGSWSRAYEQRSLRLMARSEYEPGGSRFNYAFFPGDMAFDGSETPIERYNTLILRNGGNDRRFGMLRNELGSVLARQLGINVVTPVRPAAIYINGEYWGFAWLQVRMDERYMQDLYNALTRNFDIVGMGELWVVADCPVAYADIRYKNAFATRDLLDDEEFARLEAIVDIEDMLWYYAFQIFVGNGDWPHNNLRRWRYTGEWHEGMAPELDGRWRYLVFDLDWILGLYGDDYHLPTFQRVLEQDNTSGALLRNVLTRPEQQQRFMEIMREVAAVVTPENVAALLDEMYGASYYEIGHALAAGRYDHWVGRNSIADNHANMIRFAAGRPSIIFDRMEQLWGE
ncbi:MAG: CotH kinase family protein [Defluviitaleaceae bacterium]|nr:CotH kinase family protein [Defluviitaleaceae bacterium]